MKIIKSAPGRVALVGNPFDIYGGSTISLTLRDMRSYVCVELDGIKHQQISSEIYRPGNNRGKQKNELEHAVIEELDLQYDYFRLSDVSDMPYETGFARSTAAVVAMIRAFNTAFNLGIKDNEDIAEFAWRIERKLGVCGGQERYAIAHDDFELSAVDLERRINLTEERSLEEIKHSRPGKLFYMNFAGRENHRFDNVNYAIISELQIPPMKLAAAYSTKGSSSFDYHQALREIFRNSEKGREIISGSRDQSVLITNRALGEFKKKNPSIKLIGEYMSQSLDCRFRMFDQLIELGFRYGSRNIDILRMRQIAEGHGALGVNQPGSKSIIFLYEDESSIMELEKKGYHVIKIGG